MTEQSKCVNWDSSEHRKSAGTGDSSKGRVKLHQEWCPGGAREASGGTQEALEELLWRPADGDLQCLGARLGASTLEAALTQEWGEGGAFKGEERPLGPR